MRTGNMFGPDATFVGVPAADLDDPASYADAAVVIIGAPYDAGTSHRPGSRFGPYAIRTTDYLPHDGERPHLALGVDPLVALHVVDVGDVVMPSVDTDGSLARLEAAVERIAESGAIPLVLGGDHTIAWPDATGCGPSCGLGTVVDGPLRRPRRYRQHAVRVAHRTRHAHAPAHRVRRRTRRPLPPDRPARATGPSPSHARLDGRPAHAQLRDDRSRRVAGSMSA